jgi:hypothetical protein
VQVIGIDLGSKMVILKIKFLHKPPEKNHSAELNALSDRISAPVKSFL